jgi:hypothetical protein
MTISNKSLFVIGQVEGYSREFSTPCIDDELHKKDDDTIRAGFIC